MSANQIHRVYLDGTYPKKDNRLAFAALLAETIAVYYWSEPFAEGRPVRLCIIGQRGLAEYAARATTAVMALIDKQAEQLQETTGFRFGCVLALRESLRRRREGEHRRPEYADQCNVSTYRAKRSLDKYYKVGVKDVPAQFDIEGYNRGLKQIWTLQQFKTPIEVLNDYARTGKRYDRTRETGEDTLVQDRGSGNQGGRDSPTQEGGEESAEKPSL